MVTKAKTNGAAPTPVAVVKSGGVIAFDPTKFETGTKNMAQASAGRAEFLKMDKSGDWVFGANDIPVGPNDLIYIDPMGSVHGWQCWADTDIPGQAAELMGTVTVPHYDPMPEKPTEVPKNGRDWAEMYGLSAIMAGHKLVYTTTSVGGRDAISKLAADMLGQFRIDRTKMVAAVSLSSDWYKHKKWGKLYVPVFSVQQWLAAPPADALVMAADPPPKKTTAAKAGPKATLKRPMKAEGHNRSAAQRRSA